HSVNSILASQKGINDNDVSMHIRPETRSMLSKYYKSKTVDEIKRDIEQKRGTNRKLIDEMSKRSSRRSEIGGVFDYEEKKRILSNYYKEKEKTMKEFELNMNSNMIKPS